MSSDVVSVAVARAAYAAKAVQRAVRALGPNPGLRLGLTDLRGESSEARVAVPGAPDLTQLVRLGRRETDLATFVHVFGDRSYEFDEVGDDPTWIIDAGANVGYSTSWFASRYPRSTVIAIEPDQTNFRLLTRNTSGFANVIPLRCALSDKPGEALVVDPGQGSWGMQVQRSDQRWSTAATTDAVSCVTIDQLIAEYRMKDVDLLKLDIEGGELEVLQSSSSWMPKVQVLVAELHDRFRPGCTRAFIEATDGFSVEAVRGENFLVARTHNRGR